jgi:hypothetical protein
LLQSAYGVLPCLSSPWITTIPAQQKMLLSFTNSTAYCPYDII